MGIKQNSALFWLITITTIIFFSLSYQASNGLTIADQSTFIT